MKTICGIMNTKWKGEKSEQKKKNQREKRFKL